MGRRNAAAVSNAFVINSLLPEALTEIMKPRPPGLRFHELSNYIIVYEALEDVSLLYLGFRSP